MVMTSANFLWLLRDFVQEYHNAMFGGDWTASKGEIEGARYILPKKPSLNRVKAVRERD